MKGDPKTATEVALEINNKAEAEQLVADFQDYWRSHGEPPPYSAAYLSLNRAFFYTRGLEKGLGTKFDVS